LLAVGLQIHVSQQKFVRSEVAGVMFVQEVVHGKRWEQKEGIGHERCEGGIENGLD